MARNINRTSRKPASPRKGVTYKSADEIGRYRGDSIDDNISLHLRRSKKASPVKPEWSDHDGAVHNYKIDASVKRRARLLSTNGLIPFQTRSMIRYALQIKDPYLVQIVHRVEAGEMTIDHIYL
jgi:hypothetical protein